MAVSPLHGWACPICAAALAEQRRRRRAGRCAGPARGRQSLKRPYSPPVEWLLLGLVGLCTLLLVRAAWLAW